MKQKNPLSENTTKGDLLILKNELETKLNDLEYKLDGNAQKYRDQVLTSNDKLAKQLETMREENTIGFNQLNNKLNNHETRIKKIERIQQAA